MAATKCTNIELQNPSAYATLQVSKRQQSQYDLPQQQQHIYESPQVPNEKPAVSSLVPELEVVSSNIQHVTNSVGNYSIQKERVKWSILLILLIASTLLNVVTLITLFTTRCSSCNTSSSCDNTTDGKLLQQVSQLNSNIDLLKTHTELTQTSHQLLTDNIITLIDMVDGNTQLVKEHIDSIQSSQQLLVHNITALVNISNNNIQLLTTHIESSQLQQFTQASQQQLSHNITALLDMVDNNSILLDGTKKDVTSSLQKLNNIINTQSIIEDISAENKGTINNILVKVDDVLETLNSSLVSSCQDIKNKQPNSPSGYYHTNRELVYCEMGELCSTEGGWTRLAYLDMTDSTVDCPPGFMLDETAGIRSCGRPDGGGGCPSIKFPSNGISYSEVCGRVVGYQYGSPDAVYSSSSSIDSSYIDGISITQGFPRKHIWSLIAGQHESNSYSSTINCPCNLLPGTQSPSFVGNDYFCESGNPTNTHQQKVYTADPLWDGEGCGTQEGDCCAAAGLPWFHKSLSPTTDYIELRDCANSLASSENVFFSLYEIYVK